MQTPSCLWMRVVGAFVVGVVVLASAIDAAQGASAESTPEQVAARQAAASDLRTLASDVLRDYQRGGRDVITKLEKGCCGVRTIEVFYLAKPGSYAKHGAYELRGYFTHGRLSPSTSNGVLIAEFPTHGPYHLGATIGTPTYLFQLDAETRGAWTLDASYIERAQLHYTTRASSPHEQITRLTAANLSPFYGQALGVLHKAESHAPVTPETFLHPGLSCEALGVC